MFFFFSKALLFLINPIIWIISLIGYAMWVKSVKKRRILLGIALIMLLIFSNIYITNKVLINFEYPSKRISQISQTYDVGIILTGSINRIYEPLMLYKKGLIKKLFIVGETGQVQYQRTLIDLGVRPTDILIENQSKNTYESAQQCQTILNQLNKNSASPIKILLTTSALHMRRARLCFQKADLQFDVFSTDRLGQVQLSLSYIDLGASARSIFYWQLMIKECIGIIVYKIKGVI